MITYHLKPHRNTPPVFPAGQKLASGEIGHFVAVCFITAQKPSQLMRFTQMFSHTGRDAIPGFLGMQLLEPQAVPLTGPQKARSYDLQTGLSNDCFPTYLIISHWKSEQAFRAWTRSSQFIEGFKYKFSGVANQHGDVSAEMKTYTIVAN